MPAYAATSTFDCRCGGQTHVYMECDEGPAGDRTHPVYCWRCAEVTGLCPATRVWSASTAQGALRLRLMGLHEAVGQVPEVAPVNYPPRGIANM